MRVYSLYKWHWSMDVEYLSKILKMGSFQPRLLFTFYKNLNIPEIKLLRISAAAGSSQ